MTEDDRPEEQREEVGTLAEEAAKLLGVLAGWAAPVSGEDGGQAERPPAPEEPATTGATGPAGARTEDHPVCENAWCPLCRAADLFRSVSPEVREHLAVAASSLVQAAVGLLGTPVPSQEESPPPRSGPAAGPAAGPPAGPAGEPDGERDEWEERE